MDATLELTHERVDDVPLFAGLFAPAPISRGPRPPFPRPTPSTRDSPTAGSSPSGSPTFSPGPTTASPRPGLGRGSQHTLETLVGEPIRPVEFGDDRLTLVLKRLGDLAGWHALEADLWHTHCDVYALPVERVRLDATTSCGCHAINDDALMQLGHSRATGPTWPRFKLMVAAAEPGGLSWPAMSIPAMPPTTCFSPAVSAGPRHLGQTGLLYPATARSRPWRRGPRSPPTRIST